MHSLLDRSVHWGYGCFSVDFRTLLQVTKKLAKAVYRQGIYYYLVQFSCMLHRWLQKYHARIRT